MKSDIPKHPDLPKETMLPFFNKLSFFEIKGEADTFSSVLSAKTLEELPFLKGHEDAVVADFTIEDEAIAKQVKE